MVGVGRRRMLTALLCAPLGCAPSAFSCADDEQCPNGACEPSGYCSFDDADCESGRRYGAFAGDGLGRECVPVEEGTTTGTPGPTSDTPALTTSIATTSTGETTGGTRPGTGAEGSSTTTSEGSSSTGSAETTTGGAVERVEDDLLVLYRFDEGRGSTIHDTSAVDPPIDLLLEGAGHEWLPGALRFTGESSTMAYSTSSVTKIDTACQATDEITLEAWITPHDLSLAGPPRIFSYSLSSGERNFSLLAGADLQGVAPAFRSRLRVSEDGLNGVPPLIAPVTDDATDTLAHLVFVHDQMGAEHIFVDGAIAVSGERPGSFSSWDTTGSMQLVLGNELGGSRALDATLHLVAVYCRALSPDEVLQNLEAGL